MPIKKTLFLHITDTHVALMPGQSPNDIGNPSDLTKIHHQHFEERDPKVPLKATTSRTRLQVFRETIGDIADELMKQKRTLSGIILSGDIGIYGIGDGATPYRDMLLEHFHGLGITTKNIVVTPGNHDIKSV